MLTQHFMPPFSVRSSGWRRRRALAEALADFSELMAKLAATSVAAASGAPRQYVPHARTAAVALATDADTFDEADGAGGDES
eukprot:7391521-Prymnesium_polylepis.2